MTRDAKFNWLWHPCVNTPHPAFKTSANSADTATLCHKHLGHAHPDAVIRLLCCHQNLAISQSNFSPCDACTFGKLRQSPSTSSFHCAPQLLNVFHSDFMGTLSPAYASVHQSIISFIDDHTLYNKISPTKRQDEALPEFLQYKTMVEQ